MRSKELALALIIVLPFVAGCASSRIRKPTVFVDKPNSIPADIPSQFDSRYERFISDKEMDAFHKLQTDEERQAFQDKFWLDRDPDPSTPENERKQEIDDRIEDIANERFFGTNSLLFRSNGGFRGDMAKVYLLHGEPDAMDQIEGSSFVPMMLWLYGNPENGNILYAFLFYQKGGSGSYKLFFQDSYQMDRCGALYEVATPRMYTYPGGGMQSCPDDLIQVYNDVFQASGRGGVLDGNIFAWALFNFSQSGSNLEGKALSPPKPASEIAKQSKSRVTGEAPKLAGAAGTDYILSSCKACNSMIPAELALGQKFIISGPWKNFDWKIVGDNLELSLKFRIVIQDHNGGKPIVAEDVVVSSVPKSFLLNNPSKTMDVPLLSPVLDSLPRGSYSVSVYIKNMMTKKYNAWSKEIIIK